VLLAVAAGGGGIKQRKEDGRWVLPELLGSRPAVAPADVQQVATDS